MNQVDYRHYFKGRVWKNEGCQKVQEVGMYLFFLLPVVVVRRMQSEGLLSRTVSGLEFSGNILSSNTLNKAKFIQTNE